MYLTFHIVVVKDTEVLGVDDLAGGTVEANGAGVGSFAQKLDDHFLRIETWK